MEGKKKMYTTQEEMRGEKERGDPGGGMTFRKDFAERRQALPPKAAGRERKGGKKGEKCVCFICLIFPLFLCIFTNTKSEGYFVYIFMYTQKRKKCICKVIYIKPRQCYACICLYTYF